MLGSQGPVDTPPGENTGVTRSYTPDPPTRHNHTIAMSANTKTIRLPNRRSRSALPHREASVHCQGLPRNEIGLRGAKEQHRAHQVFRLFPAGKTLALDNAIEPPVRENLLHRIGLREPRENHVDPDSVWTGFAGERPSKTNGLLLWH